MQCDRRTLMTIGGDGKHEQQQVIKQLRLTERLLRRLRARRWDSRYCAYQAVRARHLACNLAPALLRITLRHCDSTMLCTLGRMA